MSKHDKTDAATDEAELVAEIERLWEERTALTPKDKAAKKTVHKVIQRLDRGELRVAQKDASGWTVNQWAKKAVLLSFRLTDNAVMGADDPPGPYFDKVPTKFHGWSEDDFIAAGVRVVPGAVARRGAFIARNVVLMPSFVNIGAYVDEGAMIDAWATVGSCAQIGKNCHISGGAGIGGVLEPLQANPTIIEDDCFIGARAEVAEGVIVETGSVLSMGVYLGASTKIVDRASGEVFRGRVPAYSVVVPGSLASDSGGPNLYCAVIVKRVDAKTRSKTSVNELLRD